MGEDNLVYLFLRRVLSEPADFPFIRLTLLSWIRSIPSLPWDPHLPPPVRAILCSLPQRPRSPSLCMNKQDTLSSGPMSAKPRIFSPSIVCRLISPLVPKYRRNVSRKLAKKLFAGSSVSIFSLSTIAWYLWQGKPCFVASPACTSRLDMIGRRPRWSHRGRLPLQCLSPLFQLREQPCGDEKRR